MKKKTIVIAVILVLIIGAGGLFLFKNRGDGVKFRVEKVTRGDIRAAVTATGSMSAVVTVLVGTQVSGTIKQLFVDFNSPVKKGQLLALIDPALPQAKVEQARANLQSAMANVEKVEAALLDAKRTLERNRILYAKNFIARSDVDTAETNHQSAQAQVNVARAQVGQARAALQLEETNLRYTRILSPVEGVVISRNVDIGQTVAASFQTPTLFNIAQDLTRMQIDTNVDEADIGRILVGQPVQFSVDAYPDITFNGKVSEIRNAPTTVQNVVTYIVVIKVSNPELKLKPGMTANVSIITDTRTGVLKIPSAALRFRWTAEKAADSGKTGESAKKPEAAKDAPALKMQVLWILERDKPRRVLVTTGISDGNFTEIRSGGDLKEGDAVIIEASGNAKKSGSAGFGGTRFIR
ncbi:MAG: efflux RND transporter periplasmic adaptor subunit [Deltaproteobacteria bacterium HGW-Deltaproteobacteria-11]|nr:MAG: efflux RND transporter periplasmic adaptor subunit [Deltaproteobacteria bacterium HGW-Deltaproteobacteria-11]